MCILIFFTWITRFLIKPRVPKIAYVFPQMAPSYYLVKIIEKYILKCYWYVESSYSIYILLIYKFQRRACQFLSPTLSSLQKRKSNVKHLDVKPINQSFYIYKKNNWLSTACCLLCRKESVKMMHAFGVSIRWVYDLT